MPKPDSDPTRPIEQPSDPVAELLEKMWEEDRDMDRFREQVERVNQRFRDNPNWQVPY